MFGIGVVGVGSFVLLIVASWCVGEGGDVLGKKYDASLVGGLLIAWLNTAPEFIFFVTALRSGNATFAFGAMTGSTVVVCTVATGCCLWVGYVCRSNRKKALVLLPNVRRQCLWLLGSTLIPLVLALLGFSSLPGAVGAPLYLFFLVVSLRAGLSPDAAAAKDIESGLLPVHPSPSSSSPSSASVGSAAAAATEDGLLGGSLTAAAASIVDEEGSSEDEDGDEDDDEEPDDVAVFKAFGMLFVGGLLIFLFSSPFITSVVTIAEQLNMSPTMLAFLLAPVASEAPEILESITLARKGTVGAVNVAYSNLIGGTVTKTTLLTGLFGLYGAAYGVPWDTDYTVGLVMLAASAAAASALGVFVRRLTALHGQLLVLLFVMASAVQVVISPESV